MIHLLHKEAPITWLRLFVVALTCLLATASAQARIQTQMYCWISDVEFPVACAQDEDGGDDDEDEEAEFDSGRSSDA